MIQLIRETQNYVAMTSARGIRITAKARRVDAQSRVVRLSVWRQLETMNDASFDGSCCLELGIGTFNR